MFTTKTVSVFDREAVKPGYFITYCRIEEDWETDSMLEEYKVYKDSEPVNGIVMAVSEEAIEILRANGTERQITISQIFSPDESVRCYKILGIRENAL